MGVRWLWIDSLCIIQDDKDDWEAQAAAMAGIYENSSFTIAAHSKQDRLLPAPREWRRTFAVEEGGHSAEVHVRHVPSLSLHSGQIAAPLMAGKSIQDEPHLWNEVSLRGWCVQERMLSSVVLHFTDQEVLYEKYGRILDCHCGFHIHYMFRPPWEDINADHVARWAVPKPYGCGVFFEGDLPSVSWKLIVEHYSLCVFTRADDILPAIAGVARRLFEKTCGTEDAYVAGLLDRPHVPGESILSWLCWSSSSWPSQLYDSTCELCRVWPERCGLPLRASNATVSPALFRVLFRRPRVSHVVPSFSWASRMGPCEWPGVECFSPTWIPSSRILRRVYSASQANPFARFLSVELTLEGPLYRGLLFSSSGKSERMHGGCRAVCGYFLPAGGQSLPALRAKLPDPDQQGTPLEEPFCTVQKAGIHYILDAQDDVPSDGAEGVLLEIGRSPEDTVILLVLVPCRGSGGSNTGLCSTEEVPRYCRIGFLRVYMAEGKIACSASRFRQNRCDAVDALRGAGHTKLCLV
ncbi:hypothetical protein B0T18DRAFT_174903 [Schizothecium vesticola]|uniref:Heterokaryon incompatibility domain-containing protein n=1 Tax=Schizothecium vesticola TaxID=314040 RepID=A0AA40K271_9PEZI|nr:hypothetical protein B0T18DRAFT_174903 [Schizothecium vesticola]